MKVKLSEKLIQLMEDQHKVLKEFLEKERILRKKIDDRDWSSLQQTLSDLDRTSATMETLEQERHLAFQELRHQLGAHDWESFYQVTNRLPSEEAHQVNRVYRSLKLALIQVKGQSNGLESYLDTTTRTIKEVLNDVFPHKRGNLYNPRGRSLESNHQALFLNKQL